MAQESVGSVRGQVLRKTTGAPVCEAAIAIVRGAAPYPDLAVLTDGSGCFFLDGLAAGVWVLGAYGPGSERGEAGVNVAAGLAAEVVIQVG